MEEQTKMDFSGLPKEHGECILKKMTLFTMMLFVSFVTFAQIQVKGIATDKATGERLPFITIQLKGTTQGTTTDLDGAYSINVPGRNAVLVFSYIGYQTTEVTVGTQTQINVALNDNSELLDEVIVVGYGVQNKREVTGSIAKVSAEELTAIPASSFENALQGRAAGVQVLQSSGMASAGSTIRVRGGGAITAGGEPLIVIDGIPIEQDAGRRIGAQNENPLLALNSSDIESVEILKDASATAIYGSRGANGVLIITTKRGQKGKPQVSFNSRVTFSSLGNYIDQVSTDEYIALYKEAIANDNKVLGTNKEFTTLPGGITEELARRYNTDWQREVTYVSVSTQNDLSVGYGTDKLKTYLGLSYSDQNSFIKRDNVKRTTARLNLDYTPFKWLTAGFNFSFSHLDQTLVPVGYNGGYGRALSTALPYFPIHNDDGEFYTFPTGTNPVAEIYHRTWNVFRDRTMASAYINANIIKDLSLRVEGNLDYTDNAQYYLNGSVLTNRPTSSLDNAYSTNWNTKALLNYAITTGQHSFRFMVGTEMLASRRVTNTWTVRHAQWEEDWLYNNPVNPPLFNADGTPNSSNTSSKSPAQEYSFISFFGRLNYTFQDKYLLTATFRRDGSSRFGANNKFGNFPAVSVGWIITEEGFLKDNNTISMLKLKAGYGRTGNAEIGNYAQWGTVSMTANMLYNGQQYWRISQLSNPDLHWEKAGVFDVGLEYGLLKNRISGEISFYNKKSESLFLSVSAPASTGSTGILQNIGEVRNRGVEFMIKSRNFIGRNFTWTTDFNISYNQNKVLSLGNQSAPDAVGGTGDVRVIVGEPLGSNYLVKFLRVDPTDGAPVFEKLDPVTRKPVGETKVYSTDDRQVCGHPWPYLNGGLNNSFTFLKNKFDLSFLFSFQLGGSVYDDGEKFQMNNLGSWRPIAKALDRWQKPGDITDVPRATLGGTGIEASRNTSEYLHDASFLRLKNLSIGYNLPVWQKVKIRIYAQASNILTLKAYDGEPEIIRDMESSRDRNVSANVTYLSPPQARTFAFGLNLNF
ncbi:SusC/RagA family TonB-linked outer membrane protein [Bacteroidia bacterium]|nr:SusC/RagA family TonB-linked outer membrane protein [Bacteroidia bacterium]